MDLTALKGIAKSRWWVLVAAAIIAVVISGRLTEYRNDNLPEYQAVTWITYIEDPQMLERDDFITFLESQFALAEDVNSSLLDDTPGTFIPWLLAELDLEDDQNQIEFIGRGFTQEEADQMALAMRDEFLAASTIGAGLQRMTEELDEVTGQINELRAQIRARQQELLQQAEPDPLTSTDRANQVRAEALQTRIDVLRTRYGQLGLELLNPSLGTTEFPRSTDQIQTEMNLVIGELQRLNEVLASIPVPVITAAEQGSAQLATTEDEALLLDQLRLQQLETRWNNLYQTERELRALATVGPVVAEETDLDPVSPTSNQAVALVGTLLAVLIGLVALEKGRGILWAPRDVDEDGPATLVEVPPRPLTALRKSGDRVWYMAAQGGRRKTAIQKLRSQLDYEESSVIAFQGSSVPREDIQELVIDLGAALAISDRSILVIDATFKRSDEASEDSSEAPGVTLTDGLERGRGRETQDAMEEFRRALVHLPETTTGLRQLFPGQANGDAADALSGERFESLVEVARDLFDLVLLVGGPVTNPDSHVLAQRVDAVILVGSVGHTSVSGVEQTARDFAAYRAHLLGLVLLRRRRSRVLRWASTTLFGGSGSASRRSRESGQKGEKPAWQGLRTGAKKAWRGLRTAVSATGRFLGSVAGRSWGFARRVTKSAWRGLRSGATAAGEFLRKSFGSDRARSEDQDDEDRARSEHQDESLGEGNHEVEILEIHVSSGDDDDEEDDELYTMKTEEAVSRDVD